MTILATHSHAAGDVPTTIEFLKRTRNELRELRKVQLWTDKLHVVDVNGDVFEVIGIGYPDTEVVALLRHVKAAFNPQTIHNPVDADYKELRRAISGPGPRIA